ncbi:uncharacterized protein LOC142334548 isoform X2 [Convolutriloba macropyga]|uniref:uncharacterized protein LOC142334548 isoform X2 n=1 Tax=Convolutriloba macropyga TaxID=536237 RepID=UPI003F522485
MAASKIGHGFSRFVDTLEREETVIGSTRPSAVDSELCLSVLRGQFVQNARWRNTLKRLFENRVKTFVVSNGTECVVEREILVSQTQKFLQHFAAKNGYSFILYDYWHGFASRPEMSPKDFEMISSEFEACLDPNQGSLGPVALILHTESYGENVIPAKFTPKHFKWLLDAAGSVGVETKSLTEWFSLDDQSSPPMYEMRDISEVHKNYRAPNYPHTLADEITEASALWITSKGNLAHEMTAGVHELVRRRVFTKEQFRAYRQSDHYLDVENGFVSPTGQKKSEQMLKDLKEKVPNNLLRRKIIPWKSEGISSSVKAHKTYLSYLQTQSYLDLTRRISAAKFHQSQLLNFFTSESLLNLFLQCSNQLIHVDNLTQRSLSRDGILEWIFDTIVENREILIVPNELSGEDDWLDFVDNSLGLRSTTTGHSKSRDTGTTRTRTAHKMTSTPAFSRAGAPKHSRGNTKDKSRTQKPEMKADVSVDHLNDESQLNKSSLESDQIEKEDKASQKGGRLDENAPKVEKVIEEIVDLPDFDPTGEQIMFDQAPNYCPFFIVGNAKSGKSTMAAMIVKYANTYLPDFHLIPRFCNISEDSKTFFEVLESILHNLTRLYKGDYLKPSNLDDCVNLFKELCDQVRVSNEPRFKSRVLIVLDQLESLQSEDRRLALTLDWLPHQFSPKLLFVITVNKWCVPIMTSAKRVSREAWRHFQLPTDLSLSTCQSYVEDPMMNKHKSLSDIQKALVTRSLRNLPTIMFLDTLTTQALTWKKRLSLPGKNFHSMKHLVEVCYIQTAEAKVGKAAVRAFCSFLCASQSGLSEVELIDLLSFDNDVLHDIYAAQGVPQGNVIRLPLNWWLFIRAQFEHVVHEKKVGDTFVFQWRNDGIEAIFREKYFTNKNSEVELRQILLDYFRGTLSCADKPFHLSFGDDEVHLERPERCMSENKLKIANGVYNTRAMHQITLQLKQLLNTQEIVSFYTDFQTLVYLLRGRSLQTVIEDLSSICRAVNAKEHSNMNKNVKGLVQMLEENFEMLVEDCNNLAQVIKMTGAKSGIDEAIINEMRKDALSWFLRNTSPLMMPIEIANQIADLPEADADTTYKVNPTSIIKLDSDIRKAFTMTRGEKIVLISSSSRKLFTFAVKTETLSEEKTEKMHLQLLTEIAAGFALSWSGMEWTLLNDFNWTQIKLPTELPPNRAQLDTGEPIKPRIVPSHLGSDCFSLQYEAYDVISPNDHSHSEDGDMSQSKMSVVSRSTVEMFSFKTKEWYRLPEISEPDLNNLVFVVPFFETMQNSVVVYVLSDGHVILVNEDFEWVIRDPDEEFDDDEDALGDFGMDKMIETHAADEFAVEVREEAVVFKEDQAADDFEVQVIDEKPPATTEQIDDTFRTPDDLDLPLNDEMEASTLSPVAWKKVSVIKRRVLRIDFSNDPLRKSQLPILYANLLCLFTESALIIVDLIQVKLTRVYCDQLYDVDLDEGLLILKSPEYPTPVLFNLETQNVLSVLPENQHFLKFISNTDLIMGQKGSYIRIYKFTNTTSESHTSTHSHYQTQQSSDENFAEQVFEFNDVMINPQLGPICINGKAVLFTEAGLAVYNIHELVDPNVTKEVTSLYELFFEDEKGSLSEKGSITESTFRGENCSAIECYNNTIVVAYDNRIVVHNYDKNTTLCQERQLIPLIGLGKFDKFLHISVNDDDDISNINFATILLDEIKLNAYDFESDSTNTYHEEIVENDGDSLRLWAKEHFVVLHNGKLATLFDSVTGHIVASFDGDGLIDSNVTNVNSIRTTVLLYTERLCVGVTEKTLSSRHSSPDKIASVPNSEMTNGPITVQFKDPREISVFTLKNQSNRTGQHPKLEENRLTFKSPVYSVAPVTSTKLIIALSQQFHIFDSETGTILSTTEHCQVAPSITDVKIRHLTVDQSDSRTALCLLSRGPKWYLSLIDTTTGKTVYKTILSSSIMKLLAENTTEIALKSTNKRKLITLEFKDAKNRVTAFVFATNSAAEEALCKIRTEIPAPLKTANSITSQFSPLIRQDTFSTRPVNLIPI